MKDEVEEDSDTNTTVRTKSPKEPPDSFKCGVCKKIFKRDTFAEHMATHSGKEVHKCHICQNEFSKIKYLQRHVRNIHTDKRHKYRCSFCDKTFAFNAKLKSHEMVHTGEKPYKCEVCGKSFRAQYCYKTHMLTHSDEKPFKCSHCAYACRDSSTLRKHEAVHTGQALLYQCAKCDKQYRGKWMLKEHIAEVHLGLNVRLTECPRCDKKFKSKSLLSVHIRCVHERAKVGNCEICGKRVSNVANMPAHLRTHSTLKPYGCPEDGCEMRFRTKGDAKKHFITHNARRKTPCLQCGRRFARVNALRKHELTQHVPKVKNTECEICGVKFYNDNYLLKHLHQKHSSFKEKYECDLCGLVTQNKPSIVMHLKYGHKNDKDVQCKICKIIFKQHKYLKLHYLRSHNLRYKPTKRKPPRQPAPPVEVKEEPLDIEEHDLDGALENAEIVNAEEIETIPSEDLSGSFELSETLAGAIIADNVGALTSIPEKIFDEFYIKHLKNDAKRKEKNNLALEPQIKQHKEELESQRAQDDWEKHLAEERDKAIQECLERARQGNQEAPVERKQEEIQGKRRKRNYRTFDMLLACDLCGKECKGLAAFKSHTRVHSKKAKKIGGVDKVKDADKYRGEDEICGEKKVGKNGKVIKEKSSKSKVKNAKSDESNIKVTKAKLSESESKLRKTKLSKTNDRLKDFYDLNVKDLGVDFEQFVKICKEVRKDK